MAKYQRLFIAEKPSVGQDIAGALGGKVIRKDGFLEVGNDAVTWCVGHLLEQAPPEAYGEKFSQWSLAALPIVPTGSWKMQASKRTASQLRIVGDLLKSTACVVNAGDSAREGQLIIDEVLTHFNYQGAALRLWLREMGRAAIAREIGRMKDNRQYRPLLDSALARQRADWLIGLNMTRAYTCAAREKGGQGVLHVGRVQTPTLAMIVNRDREIESFVPKDYFVLKGAVHLAAGSFEAVWQPPKGAPFLDADGRIANRAAADAMAKAVTGKAASISSCETTPRKEAPPLPFSLGDLQKEASTLLGLSPSETLSVAQSLYEKHKLISYPRTDYSHLPEGEHRQGEALIDAARKTMGSAWDFAGTPDFSLRSHAWNDKKIGDHHGLRPTSTAGDFSALSKNEKAIYRLVVRNFLAQFYPHRAVESTKVCVSCEGEKFAASGLVELAPGWRQVIPPARQEDPPLPRMKPGDAGRMEKASVSAEKTKPPQRFDGGSLIDAMERAHRFVTDPKIKELLKEKGIGTPATRASIVDSLLSRGYVEEGGSGKRRHYVSTARGRALIDTVDDALRKPDITAFCESLIELVATEEMDLVDFIERQALLVTSMVDRIRRDGIHAGAIATFSAAPKSVAEPKKKGAAKRAPGKTGGRAPAATSGAKERTSTPSTVPHKSFADLPI